ncbi:hypothetical protein [Sphingobacterium detergens]
MKNFSKKIPISVGCLGILGSSLAAINLPTNASANAIFNAKVIDAAFGPCTAPKVNGTCMSENSVPCADPIGCDTTTPTQEP